MCFTCLGRQECAYEFSMELPPWLCDGVVGSSAHKRQSARQGILASYEFTKPCLISNHDTGWFNGSHDRIWKELLLCGDVAGRTYPDWYKPTCEGTEVFSAQFQHTYLFNPPIFIQDNFTALMKACTQGHSDIVKALLHHPEINVNLQNSVRNECIQCIRRFLFIVSNFKIDFNRMEQRRY